MAKNTITALIIAYFNFTIKYKAKSFALGEAQNLNFMLYVKYPIYILLIYKSIIIYVKLFFIKI